MFNDSEEREFLEYLTSFGNVFKDASMNLFTTFACGGKADILIIPENNNETLSSLLKFLGGQKCPVSIIGGGSNLLVGDKGIRGVVIAIRETDAAAGRISLEKNGLVYADAMVRKSRFINTCLSFGLGGIEFAAGIPGCIGGGIAMNAGTDMGNFSGILKSFEYLRRDGQICLTETVNAGYRELYIEDGALISGAYFQLPEHDPVKAKHRIDEILKARLVKHPLEYPSAGSVFKNPKGAAAWKLVDDAGFRGKRIGGAMVSEKHTNFIVNSGGASAADVRELIELIQETVMEKFSINMETELKLMGEF